MTSDDDRLTIKRDEGSLRKLMEMYDQAATDGDKPSTSRVIALLGVVVTTVVTLGVGYAVVWRILHSDEHALRRTDAKPEEVQALKMRLEQFESDMQKRSFVYGVASYVILGSGVLCGVGSLIFSLKNKGTVSAVLAIAVGGLVASNSFLRFDTRDHLYQSLAAAASAEAEKVARPRLHFAQIMDSEMTLARLKQAVGAAGTGDITGTLQAFTTNTQSKH